QWDKKQPGEWNEKDAKKLLSDSPWAQSQTFADPNQSTRTARSNDQSQTAIVEEVYATLRVRFFSSKPIRQAIARTLALQLGEKITEEQTAQLKQMAEFDFSNQIVVTVLVDSSKPSQFSRQAMATLGRLTTESLKGKTYLEVKGAKRVDLQEYQRPQRDGFGARLIFPRLVDGQPVIAETSEVIVNSELGGPFSIKMKFKAKDMVYQGKLDY
ncbi:MAG TPA: hypothetical protein VFV34_19405, partial [Blastocatellia bacterium]|nr:hypothetical protein [Blastocatellia bacterium]